MMQHGDVRTFLNHYLPRRVTVDTAAIFRGLDPQESIMRAACTMSRWIDPGRPWGLTAEQALSINNDPIIVTLHEHRSRLKKSLGSKVSNHSEYSKLEKHINSEKQRLRRELLKEIQERYEREGPVQEIERQLSDIKVEEDRTREISSLFSDETLPEQRRLIETLILAPPGANYEEEVQRRNNAINAITAYCKIEEGPTSRLRKSGVGRAKPIAKNRRDLDDENILSPQDKALEAAMLSVFKDTRPTLCFLCVGNTALPLDERIRLFSSPGNLSVHFKRRHLSNIRDGETIECNVCSMHLDHKMHLQRHAFEIHGTVS
jgi:hypothetical protein